MSDEVAKLEEEKRRRQRTTLDAVEAEAKRLRDVVESEHWAVAVMPAGPAKEVAEWQLEEDKKHAALKAAKFANLEQDAHCRNIIEPAVAEAKRLRAVVECERRAVAVMPESPAKETAKRRLTEDEKHAESKASEVAKLEEDERRRQREVLDALQTDCKRLREVVEAARWAVAVMPDGPVKKAAKHELEEAEKRTALMTDEVVKLKKDEDHRQNDILVIAEAEAKRLRDDVECERGAVAVIPEGPVKEAAKRQLEEDEKCAALMAAEVGKVKEVQRRRRREVIDVLKAECKRLRDVVEAERQGLAVMPEGPAKEAAKRLLDADEKRAELKDTEVLKLDEDERCRDIREEAETECTRMCDAVDAERLVVAVMPEGPGKEAAKRQLEEDEKCVALKIGEVVKLEEVERHKKKEVIDALKVEAQRLSEVAEAEGRAVSVMPEGPAKESFKCQLGESETCAALTAAKIAKLKLDERRTRNELIGKVEVECKRLHDVVGSKRLVVDFVMPEGPSKEGLVWLLREDEKRAALKDTELAKLKEDECCRDIRDVVETNATRLSDAIESARGAVAVMPDATLRRCCRWLGGPPRNPNPNLSCCSGYQVHS